MTAHPLRSVARLAALATAAAVTLAPTAVSARVHLSLEEALRVAFGDGAAVERKSVILSESQGARARDAAGPGIDLPSAIVTRYEGRRDGVPLGFAYFDTHVVRTLRETLMIVVAPDGSLARVEVVVFVEPEDYLPNSRWLEQFRGKRLERELSLKRGIHGITGATLSARAVTDATRRILAVHRTLESGNGELR